MPGPAGLTTPSTRPRGARRRRVYEDDRARVDGERRAAPPRTPRASVEPGSAKPRGKLTRSPAGRVATLPHATRRVFAVAYSRMGNDLMAQSSLPMLQA